jgi:hypothetical protein
VKLRADLEQRGIKLTPKLTYQSTSPVDADTLALLRANKDDLLRDLAAPDSVPKLPWQLERLLSAANSGQLPQGMQHLESGLVFDLSAYALACGASYLIGDREEALRRLWQAHRAWQGTN